MQNAAFQATGLDWVYVPLPVRAARLADAVRGLVALGLAGANVTIPHKASVLALCDEVDEVAWRARSVNTLVVRDGRVHGSSTDGLAITGAVDAGGARALVLGAGGAARAAAAALADAGAQSVAVSARRGEQAAELARLVGCEAIAWPAAGEWTLIVNATPLREELPLEPRPGQVIVDLAYLPDGRETALVAAAAAAGCTVVDGLEILVRQGAASFERWTGVPAPVEAMRGAIRHTP
ncbi:MAG: shikimate dehydrogenase [Thermoleophilia bacterium]|nr:shikimate dehydrogenase [Thermoleophilia bacterium]